MIYPNSFETKIGFDKIAERLKTLCLGEAGKRMVDQISFSDSYKKVVPEVDKVFEFLNVLIIEKPFPAQDYYDLTDELLRIKTEGTYIETDRLCELRLSYKTVEDILDYLYEKQEDFPNLFSVTKGVEFMPLVPQLLNRILDESGQIRDNASEALYKIRTDIQKSQQQIEKRIKQIFQQLKKEGTLSDDAEMTMRNGRCVIPIPSSGKRKIKGFVHDESTSGQTVFIEPSEIFEQNNTLRELENAEKKEIIKILKQCTDALRPYCANLIYTYKFLGTIDFLRAKALYAKETNATRPNLLDFPKINWQQAVNPILSRHLISQNKKVIPLNIALEKENRILVISGPNAGGKSVALKTVALLQYMLQCGLLVSVNPLSEFGFFNDILLEIGDEQSIENDLSTYSSHLRSLKAFLNHANSQALFLIDEFGSGTDPLLGGAIAEATLTELNQKKSFGIISTHYPNLKELAAKTPGIVNGSMLFNIDRMQPEYKLNIGNSGSSYAFELAEKAGFPEHVLNRAIEIAGKEKIEFEKQLQHFEFDKEELIKEREKVKMADDFFSDLIDKYKNLQSKLESDKKNIIDAARAEALAIVKNANARVENTIKQIKEAQAEKKQTVIAREKLKTFEKELTSNLQEQENKKSERKKEKKEQISPVIKKLDKIPEKGDMVRIPGQTLIGEITEIKNKVATVVYENFTASLPVNMLEVVDKKEVALTEKKARKASRSSLYHNIDDKISDYKETVDVRGKRAEEALQIIEKQIDDALILRHYHFKILHGKGYGILRRVIRELLARNKNVQSFADESVEFGGDGITLVYLKHQ